MQIFELVKRREHLTVEGLHKIVAIKASMNLGLSDVQKKAFPDVVPVSRPLGPAGARPRWTGPRGPVKNQIIRDPN